MAASKDYSGTPLSQKLGAKPGAGVVVFFTVSREDLERRFESLKATLDPADGLWIAWPKRAAKIEGDLTFEAVQEIGLARGLVDNKSCSIDDAGRRSASCTALQIGHEILGLAGPVPGLFVPADHVRIDSACLRRGRT